MAVTYVGIDGLAYESKQPELKATSQDQGVTGGF